MKMRAKIGDFTPFGTGKYKGTSRFERREHGILPPAARELLAEVGDEKIHTLQLARNTFIGSKDDKKTFGHLSKAIEKSGVGDLYHASLVINGKYILEKSITVQFYEHDYRGVEGRDFLYIPLPRDFDETILDFLYNAREYMGRKDFSTYNVTRNNCQTFVEGVLKGNNLWNRNPEVKNFVKQDAEKVFSYLPSYQKPIADFYTYASEVYDKYKEGEGIRKKRLTTNPWIAHVKAYAKKHNIPYNEAIKKARSTYRR